MSKFVIYLKSGQCFDVVADNISCKYSQISGDLLSIKWSGATQNAPLFINVAQVAAVVQLFGGSAGNDG